MQQENIALPRLPFFVDQKKDLWRSFETRKEKWLRGLFVVADVAMLAVKVAFLIPWIGPIAAIAGVVGISAVSKWWMHKVNRDKCKELYVPSSNGPSFDFDWKYDRQRFEKYFGRHHPNFINDYCALAKKAGLKRPPLVFMTGKAEAMCHMYREEDDFKLEKCVDNLAYSAESLSRNYNVIAQSDARGNNPVIHIGIGAMRDVSSDGMRGIIAHEFTHLHEHHSRALLNAKVLNPAHILTELAIYAGQAFGPISVLTTTLSIIGLVIARGLVKAAERRHLEYVADRGAVALTGEANVVEGIKTLSKYKAPVLRSMGKQIEYKGIKAWFLKYPSDSAREKQVNNFIQKNSAFCERQSADFPAQPFTFKEDPIIVHKIKITPVFDHASNASSQPIQPISSVGNSMQEKLENPPAP